MEVKAPAKINLALDIVKKREDGYHELCMIMQTVSLYDTINIEKADKIKISCNDPKIPTNEKNLVYKAADAFFKHENISGGCEIYLKKSIPDGAGLGGGSSDAAETILVLNKLYNTNLTEESMKNIAVKIGADVPFFISKGTCVSKGIGEKLTATENNLKGTVLICKPNFSVSTKWAYENFDLSKKKNYNFKKVLNSVKTGDINCYSKYKFNVFEDVVKKYYPETEEIKKTMLNCGSKAAMMTGSGSAIFGIFDDDKTAETAISSLKKYKCFLTKFI